MKRSPLHLKIFHIPKGIRVFMLLIFFSFSGSAQNVFPVKFQNQADVKIFEVAFENQADLKVYRVNFKNHASDCNGNWYFTQFENQADKKLFFVAFENQADLKIYYVKFRNQAGWVNEDKKQLLCPTN